MNFLTQQLGPLPLWAWLAVGAAGVGLAFVLRGKGGGGSSAALGQNAAGQVAEPPIDQSLYDPFTGAPLAAETAINPATGEPNYYNPPPSTPTTPGPGPKPGPTPAPKPGPTPTPTPTPTPKPPPAGHWWDNLLHNSRYTVPHNMTLNQVASQFGISWEGIAYNPNNQSLQGGKFLHNSYLARGSNTVQAGTALWIPTSTLPSQRPGTVTGTGPTGPYQATPYWPTATDLGRR